MIPLIFWSSTVFGAAKQPHNIRLPPPCLIVGMVLLGLKALPFRRKTLLVIMPTKFNFRHVRPHDTFPEGFILILVFLRKQASFSVSFFEWWLLSGPVSSQPMLMENSLKCGHWDIYPWGRKFIADGFLGGFGVNFHLSDQKLFIFGR